MFFGGDYRATAFASEITAAAFDGSAAIRPVKALTVDVSSVRDVPGIEAGNEGVLAEADTCRASRIVATTTKTTATTAAQGIRALLMTHRMCDVRSARVHRCTLARLHPCTFICCLREECRGTGTTSGTARR